MTTPLQLDFVDWGERAHLDAAHLKAGGRFVIEFKKSLTPSLIKNVRLQVNEFVARIFPLLRDLSFYEEYSSFNYVCAVGDYFYCYTKKHHGSDILIKDPVEIMAPSPQTVAKWLAALYEQTPANCGDLAPGAEVWASDPYYNDALPAQCANSLFGAVIERAALGVALMELIKTDCVENFISVLEIMAVCKKYEDKLKRLVECPPEYKPLNIAMVNFVYSTA